MHTIPSKSISPFDDVSDGQFGIDPNASIQLSSTHAIVSPTSANVTGTAEHIRDKNATRWKHKKQQMLKQHYGDDSPEQPATPGSSGPSSDAEHPHVGEVKVKKALQ